MKALNRCFQGAGHQPCRVHFARNLLAHVGKDNTDMVAAMFRTVFAQPMAQSWHRRPQRAHATIRSWRALVARHSGNEGS